MKKLPNIENSAEQGESDLEKSDLLKVLEIEGLTEENKEKVSRWRDEKLAKIDIENKSQKEIREAQIRVDMEMVDFFLAVGDEQGALDTLGENCRPASNEGLTDLYNEICDALDALEEKTGLKANIIN